PAIAAVCPPRLSEVVGYRVKLPPADRDPVRRSRVHRHGWLIGSIAENVLPLRIHIDLGHEVVGIPRAGAMVHRPCRQVIRRPFEGLGQTHRLTRQARKDRGVTETNPVLHEGPPAGTVSLPAEWFPTNPSFHRLSGHFWGATGTRSRTG